MTLDFDARHRRRVRMTTDQGEDFLLNLGQTTALTAGDLLGLDDGRWIRVVAADEQVIEVRHPDDHGLVRLAWHLGNRHLPVEIADDVLNIRPDHVIESMLEGLGAEIVRVAKPFQPEGGAYSGIRTGGHDHGGHSHGGHSHDGHSTGHPRDAHSHGAGSHDRPAPRR